MVVSYSSVVKQHTHLTQSYLKSVNFSTSSEPYGNFTPSISCLDYYSSILTLPPIFLLLCLPANTGSRQIFAKCNSCPVILLQSLWLFLIPISNLTLCIFYPPPPPTILFTFTSHDSLAYSESAFPQTCQASSFFGTFASTLCPECLSTFRFAQGSPSQ